MGPRPIRAYEPQFRAPRPAVVVGDPASVGRPRRAPVSLPGGPGEVLAISVANVHEPDVAGVGGRRWVVAPDHPPPVWRHGGRHVEARSHLDEEMSSAAIAACAIDADIVAVARGEDE